MPLRPVTATDSVALAAGRTPRRRYQSPCILGQITFELPDGSGALIRAAANDLAGVACDDVRRELVENLAKEATNQFSGGPTAAFPYLGRLNGLSCAECRTLTRRANQRAS